MVDAANGDFWIALNNGSLMHGVLKPTMTGGGSPASGDNDPSLPIVRPLGGRSVSVEFRLARPADVSLVLYNVAGRRVATLERSFRTAGPQRVTWDTQGLPRGVYLCAITAGGAQSTARIVITR